MRPEIRQDARASSHGVQSNGDEKENVSLSTDTFTDVAARSVSSDDSSLSVEPSFGKELWFHSRRAFSPNTPAFKVFLELGGASASQVCLADEGNYRSHLGEGLFFPGVARLVFPRCGSSIFCGARSPMRLLAIVETHKKGDNSKSMTVTRTATPTRLIHLTVDTFSRKKI